MSKLVRDKLKDLYPDNTYRQVVSKQEHLTRLGTKVLEEFLEVEDAISEGNEEHIVEEFADLLQVVEDYIKIAGVSRIDVALAKTRKAVMKGGFTDGLIMTECDLWDEK